MKIADPSTNQNMVKNMEELNRRGYDMRINEYLNENEWTKGDMIVSVHTVSGCVPGYFKSLLDQKESKGFQFEVR